MNGQLQLTSVFPRLTFIEKEDVEFTPSRFAGQRKHAEQKTLLESRN
jgi:hypothetical protein